MRTGSVEKSTFQLISLMNTTPLAMAAPAMTVSRLMERMVYSNLFFIINGLKINGDCSSTKLRKEPFRGCKDSIFFDSKGQIERVPVLRFFSGEVPDFKVQRQV